MAPATSRAIGNPSSPANPQRLRRYRGLVQGSASELPAARVPNGRLWKESAFIFFFIIITQCSSIFESKGFLARGLTYMFSFFNACYYITSFSSTRPEAITVICPLYSKTLPFESSTVRSNSGWNCMYAHPGVAVQLKVYCASSSPTYFFCTPLAAADSTRIWFAHARSRAMK